MEKIVAKLLVIKSEEIVCGCAGNLCCCHAMQLSNLAFTLLLSLSPSLAHIPFLFLLLALTRSQQRCFFSDTQSDFNKQCEKKKNLLEI